MVPHLTQDVQKAMKGLSGESKILPYVGLIQIHPNNWHVANSGIWGALVSYEQRQILSTNIWTNTLKMNEGYTFLFTTYLIY